MRSSSSLSGLEWFLKIMNTILPNPKEANMNSMFTLPIGLETLTSPRCPWFWLRSTFGLPNVDWCEENLCQWATEPANTYSNIAYLVIGIVVWRQATLPSMKNNMVVAIGPLAFIMGAFSMIYHASITYAFQLFDFLGMFLYLFHLLSFNMVRLKWLRRGSSFTFLMIMTFIGMAMVHFMRMFGLPYQSLVGVQVAGLLVTEAVLYKRRPTGTNYKWLFRALALNAIGGAFSFMDVSRIFCPQSHIVQGHAIWHLFTAFGVYAAFQFYAQFRLVAPK